jgi:hypothetical protein
MQSLSSFHHLQLGLAYMSMYFLTLSNIPLYAHAILVLIPSYTPGPCLSVHVFLNVVQNNHVLPALVLILSCTPGPCLSAHVLPNLVQHFTLYSRPLSSFFRIHLDLVYLSMPCLTLSNITVLPALVLILSYTPGPCLSVHVLLNLVQHNHVLPALVLILSYTPGPCPSVRVFPNLVQHYHVFPALVLPSYIPGPCLS